jgi:hypothetical protein
MKQTPKKLLLWAAKVLHAASEKNVFSNANISGHRQDIKDLLTVLNFTFMFHGENYQQIIFRTLSSETFIFKWQNLEKIVLLPAKGSFSKFLLKKKRRF